MPEAQVDRFMLKIKITYPAREDEKKIMDIVSSEISEKVNRVVDPKKIRSARKAVKNSLYGQ